MADECTHGSFIRKGTPSALGCEECLKIGSEWVHLRLCRTCGHVGCCDQSPRRHATKHFHATKHPVIEGYDPPEGWGWCYIDEVFLDLGDDTHAAESGRSRDLFESLLRSSDDEVHCRGSQPVFAPRNTTGIYDATEIGGASAIGRRQTCGISM